MGGAPSVTGLRPRDYKLVRMLAEGHTHAACAKVFGLKTDTIRSMLRDRPSLRRLLDETAAALGEEVAKALARSIALDAPKSVAFLQQVRDREIAGQGDKADDLRVRVVATRTLLDRQLPKRSEVSEERTVRFVFAAEDRRQIEADLEVVGVALPDTAAED